VKGFPDSACADGDFEADDYSGEEDWMSPFYQTFRPAVSLNSYISDNAPYFTHTTDGRGFWNRKVDYIFTNCSYASEDGRVYQKANRFGDEPMSLSDHCAVAARVILK
jgi:endonuclease/exonuclease/phosphatase family metal-dependent hydrolase